MAFWAGTNSSTCRFLISIIIIMYTRPAITSSKLVIHIAKRVLFFTCYSVVIYFLYYNFERHRLAIPMSIEAILGTAISILLGFRTSAAYDRWWEARIIWGSIINESRTLIRQALGFISSSSSKENDVRQLVKYQIAWCYALTSKLRNVPLSSEVKSKLSTEEYEELAGHDNAPNAILKFMQDHLAGLFEAGKLNSYHYASMDQTLRTLCDNMGRCERIKNTVFPVYYTFFTQTAILIFAYLLPFSLVAKVGAYMILITVIVVGTFSIIEMIAKYLQDPFENRPSDVAMTAISRTIEINLMQMIGESDVPESMKPDKNGILM